MTTESTTETALRTARELLPWGTTIYTITHPAGNGSNYVSPLVVTEYGGIIDLTETLGALGFEGRPGLQGIRIDSAYPEIASATLVQRISEAIHDDPAELMHEQL